MLDRDAMGELLSEHSLHAMTLVLVRVVEAIGVLVIFVGAGLGLVRFVAQLLRRDRSAHFTPLRLEIGRFLALGLEFQLAADLLRTAVSPTFEEIGMLAAVAAIRTALNYFLSHEIEQERRQLEGVRSA